MRYLAGSIILVSSFIGGNLSPLCSPPTIEIWHGTSQRIGHLGDGQDDFNVLGRALDPGNIQSVSYTLNGGASKQLSITLWRRIAVFGDFNADIPIRNMVTGINTIRIRAQDKSGGVTEQVVTVEKVSTGSYPLPVNINWSAVSNPANVGQYVDGQWGITEGGLQTLRTGYDRIFLIGQRTWKDFEVTVPVTILRVDPETSPISGPNGVGIILRFTGHIIGGHRDFPDEQPKWGYQPFGAIGWLRFHHWNNGSGSAPSMEFYNGENDAAEGFGNYSINVGSTYIMKMRCVTLPDAPDGRASTRYSYKIWRSGDAEPTAWSWEKVWTGSYALRYGGAALLSHHVNVRFGNVSIVDLDAPSSIQNISLVKPASNVLLGL